MSEERAIVQPSSILSGHDVSLILALHPPRQRLHRSWPCPKAYHLTLARVAGSKSVLHKTQDSKGTREFCLPRSATTVWSGWYLCRPRPFREQHGTRQRTTWTWGKTLFRCEVVVREKSGDTGDHDHATGSVNKKQPLLSLSSHPPT